MELTEQYFDNANEVISDEVQEIVNGKPHWVIRKGNTIFFFIRLVKSLVICFAFAIICFLPTLFSIQIPKNLTASFSFIENSSCFPTITFLSSGFLFVFIITNFDLLGLFGYH